ncbi:transmembrane protein, putative [Medicago truncatula]|uniref:Transmembrane protein, putative n=1 Tax=Medicago truncatula TaxID=3880 RepID=A0A072U975_MEDTR|nr:transmembrane protein, putative [Medicago truncatula]
MPGSQVMSDSLWLRLGIKLFRLKYLVLFGECSKTKYLQKTILAREELSIRGLINGGRVSVGILNVIWFTCIWSIWKARNEKLFNNKEVYMENIIELVKRFPLPLRKKKKTDVFVRLLVPHRTFENLREANYIIIKAYNTIIL